jgi:hypothetical protein
MRTIYYIARETGNITTGFDVTLFEAWKTPEAANRRASHLYRNCGWVAPLVVGVKGETPEELKEAAKAKARKCFRGPMTIKECRTA